MGYSVLTAPWVPVVLADGTKKYITPWQITEGLHSNPVMDVIHPRPDFNGAARELLVGLLQVCFPPSGEDVKSYLLESPPDANVLREAFDLHAEKFELIGQGGCFLQDMGGVDGQDPRPIDALPMNGPGENSRQKNKDFFVRRDEILGICPDCSVLALATKQFYASGSGPGFRTSPRGGGPLTTLLELTHPDGSAAPLWHNIYGNVLPLSLLECEALNDETAPLILPWLAPLRISKLSKVDAPTTLEHAHQLQVFFPMPSRSELVWEEGDPICSCDICGRDSKRLAVGWKTAQYGVMYVGFEHPLTPYRIGEKNEKISLKPKIDGISYPNWVAVTLGVEGSITPARNIQTMESSPILEHFSARIRAYGYQMDNASALCWHEAVLPYVPVDAAIRKDFSNEVGRFVSAAQLVSSWLVSSIKEGLFRRPKDVSGDMAHIQRELIASTTNDFFDLLHPLASMMQDDLDFSELKRDWLQILRREAMRSYDRHAPFQIAEERNLKRLTNARRQFVASLHGAKIHLTMDLAKPKRTAA